MITLKNVSRSYIGEDIETTAINNMNMTIKKGEFVSILGPSGCGKSTLLNVLGMLDGIDKGHFQLLNTNVESLSEFKRADLRKKHIGFVFQSFNLIDELTVEQNIELPLIYQNINKSQRKEIVEDVMQRVDIFHRKQHFPAKLSGGQQQRVAIARAIVAKPDLILADEPTGNLDSHNSEQVMELLQQLNQEDHTTIVMVTHAPEHIVYGTRVIRLLDGEIKSDNKVESMTSCELEEFGCA